MKTPPWQQHMRSYSHWLVIREPDAEYMHLPATRRIEAWSTRVTALESVMEA